MIGLLILVIVVVCFGIGALYLWLTAYFDYRERRNK